MRDATQVGGRRPGTGDPRIAAVRRFNRFYTRQIGVLNEGLVGSSFSLTEVRVLYELAHRKHPTATELASELGLDAGYLSRILRSFERQGLIARQRSAIDGRQSILRLKRAGRSAFATVDARSSADVEAMLAALPASAQGRLLEAMRTIEAVLGAGREREPTIVLRTHRPGDMGWVVHRHGVLYAQEYGWDERFEGLIAEIVAEFIRSFDPVRERCWMAERDGEIVGSVFVVKKSRTIAKLRLLLVEPSARGLGIGGRLVSECVEFARQAGYRRMTLWTQSILSAARQIYVRTGFRLVREEPHESFGKKLVGETWEIDL